MKLFVWNLDAEGFVNRVMAFADTEDTAWMSVCEELGIALSEIDRPEPQVHESTVVFELTGISHYREVSVQD